MLARFDREIQFYAAYHVYAELIKRAGLKLCYPELCDGKDELARETFDLALAAKLTKQMSVVADISSDSEDRSLGSARTLRKRALVSSEISLRLDRDRDGCHTPYLRDAGMDRGHQRRLPRSERASSLVIWSTPSDSL